MLAQQHRRQTFSDSPAAARPSAASRYNIPESTLPAGHLTPSQRFAGTSTLSPFPASSTSPFPASAPVSPTGFPSSPSLPPGAAAPLHHHHHHAFPSSSSDAASPPPPPPPKPHASRPSPAPTQQQVKTSTTKRGLFSFMSGGGKDRKKGKSEAAAAATAVGGGGRKEQAPLLPETRRLRHDSFGAASLLGTGPVPLVKGTDQVRPLSPPPLSPSLLSPHPPAPSPAPAPARASTLPVVASEFGGQQQGQGQPGQEAVARPTLRSADRPDRPATRPKSWMVLDGLDESEAGPPQKFDPRAQGRGQRSLGAVVGGAMGGQAGEGEGEEEGDGGEERRRPLSPPFFDRDGAATSDDGHGPASPTGAMPGLGEVGATAAAGPPSTTTTTTAGTTVRLQQPQVPAPKTPPQQAQGAGQMVKSASKGAGSGYSPLAAFLGRPAASPSSSVGGGAAVAALAAESSTAAFVEEMRLEEGHGDGAREVKEGLQEEGKGEAKREIEEAKEESKKEKEEVPKREKDKQPKRLSLLLNKMTGGSSAPPSPTGVGAKGVGVKESWKDERRSRVGEEAMKEGEVVKGGEAGKAKEEVGKVEGEKTDRQSKAVADAVAEMNLGPAPAPAQAREEEATPTAGKRREKGQEPAPFPTSSQAPLPPPGKVEEEPASARSSPPSKIPVPVHRREPNNTRPVVGTHRADSISSGGSSAPSISASGSSSRGAGSALASPLTEESPHSKGRTWTPSQTQTFEEGGAAIAGEGEGEEELAEGEEEEEEEPLCRGNPRFEHALLTYPATILVGVIVHLDYIDFHSLPQLSRSMRQGLAKGDCREVIMDRYLGELGYRIIPTTSGISQIPQPSPPSTVSAPPPAAKNGLRNSTAPSATSANGAPLPRGAKLGMAARPSGQPTAAPVSQVDRAMASHAEPPKRPGIELSLRDLHAYYTGLEFAPGEFPSLARQLKQEGIDLPTVRMIRASTRAHNKIVMRVRGQPAYLMDSRSGGRRIALPVPNEQGRYPPPLQPIFRMGRAAVLKVWVPTKQSWMNDEELVECEREIWRSETWGHIKRGDVVFNTAVGDFGNEGKLIHDGKYLRDLQYVYDAVGHVPSWLNMLTFSPAFYHNIVASSTPNPVVYLDLTSFISQVQDTLTLCQDKVDVASPQGRYRVARWVYRAAIHVKPGTMIGGSGGAGGAGPGGIEIVHSDWSGQIIIEAEGASEHAKDLIHRCSRQDLKGVPMHRMTHQEVMQIKEKARQAQLSPWRILRERSRPGKLWIRPVYDDERI